MIKISYRPNSCQVNFTFHDNTTVDGSMQYMNIQFITTGTFIAKVEAQGVVEDVWYPYPAFRYPAYELMDTNISDKNFLYNIDLNGITKIRINLISVSGAISVYGKVVS
jgi:hypothetical protein